MINAEADVITERENTREMREMHCHGRDAVTIVNLMKVKHIHLVHEKTSQTYLVILTESDTSEWIT